MEITLEMLLAKRDECAAVVAQHKSLMEANAGAVQELDELIAIARAQKPSDKPPTK